jgi:capsid protein
MAVIRKVEGLATGKKKTLPAEQHESVEKQTGMSLHRLFPGFYGEGTLSGQRSILIR